MSHNLILLVGQKQSGKDTVYKLLAEQCKIVHRFALADELKQEVARKFFVHTDEIAANKELWRPMLQWYGTEYRQQIMGEKFYWCDKVAEQLEARLPDGHVGVITDVRFPHEVEYFQDRAAVYVVKVEREALVQKDKHPSETLQTGIVPDYTIYNSYSLDELSDSSFAMFNFACRRFSDLSGRNVFGQ